MKKTDKKVFLYCRNMGWNMTRRIYIGSDGLEMVIINGSPIQLNWCASRADFYEIF